MSGTKLVPSGTLRDDFQELWGSRRTEEVMTVDQYLEEAKTNRRIYQSSHAAMVESFGKPELIDTHSDVRLSRIYENRLLRTFPAFSRDFYGMYGVIDQIYSYFLSASQGTAERQKILYLLGPVGGGKSSLAEKIKELAQEVPMYCLAYVGQDGKPQISPVFESLLGLFTSIPQLRLKVAERYDIPDRAFPRLMSPWARARLKDATQRLGESGHKSPLDSFRVIRLFPSIADQIGIAVATPGDETNQDVTVLVGKTDIHKVADRAQNDPDAYSFSGALCIGQRVLEFMEMFKAPTPTLNPLLAATMENYFTATEAIGAIPFNGVILAHSNEAEWEKFTKVKANEAFIDRIHKVKVPYVLAYSDEIRIYEKMIRNCELRDAKCAPGTLEALAQFSVLTRLRKPQDDMFEPKMRVYDGEDIHNTNPKARSLHEYREEAGVDEGMTGESTRFAFEILAKTFNFDPTEIAADPVHLLNVLTESIRQLGKDKESYIPDFVKGILRPNLLKMIKEHIRDSYLESGDSMGQALYERYITLADRWVDNLDYKDPDTGIVMDRSKINARLEEIEKPAGISNPKDFRYEVTRYSMRYRGEHGKYPSWREYGTMRKVIEMKMFKNIDDMLPVISFGKKPDEKLQQEHQNFVTRMMKRGYTEKMVRRMVELYEQDKNK
jgi:serine protein kinase